MHQQLTLAAFLIAEHIREIRQAADHERLTRMLAAERTRATWRRQTGHVARRLSMALEDLASQLDPTARRASYGRE